MRGGGPIRGQPLAALLLILVGWVGVRIATWSEADAARFAAYTAPSEHARAMQPSLAAATGAALATPAPSRPDIPRRPPSGIAADNRGRNALSVVPDPRPDASGRWVRPIAPERFATASFPTRHPLLWLAAFSGDPAPALPAPGDAVPSGFFVPPATASIPARRWAADAWVMLRPGGGAPLSAGASPAAYGDSQAGVVLRYRLAPVSGHRPQAYARVSRALDGSRESDAAIGLMARPVPAIPVVASSELRVSRQIGRTRLRPAIMAVTELPPIRLPLGGQGEIYAQGGYVGGAFATPFVDAQLRVEKAVASIGLAQVRAGAGSWVGAQKHVSRLDLGPSAGVGLPISRNSYAHLGVDWRFRVAGDATPGSGPAITLSAGF